MATFCIPAVSSQTITELSRLFEFKGSLQALTKSANDGTIDSGRMYLLSGNIDTVRMVSESPFIAEADFVEAYWEDWKDIQQFPGILYFDQAVFSDLVSVEKTDAPGVLCPRKDILVMVTFTELRKIGKYLVPVLKVVDFRFP